VRFTRIILFFSILATAYSIGQAQLPDEYTRYDEALNILSGLRDSHPDICKLDTLGYSTRDNVPMIRFKISDNAAIDEDEPAVFYCGGVHADEVLGVEVVMNFIGDILTRYDNNDLEIVNYVNRLEIYCVPFINPEGHLEVESGLSWRKNKCDNDNNEIFDYHDGVDNNRNYDFGWNIDDDLGAITPESLMYKGTAPFTQTENIAMADFGWMYRPLIAIDYHSPDYGRPNVAYYPWYWYPSDGGSGFGPDEALMQSISTSFTNLIEAIPDDSNTVHYTARRALVNKGDFKTYFYGNFGTAAFSVEISDTTIQNPALIDTIVTAHLPSQYFLLQRALGAGITGVIRDSVTMEPLEAEVQVTQHMNGDINPRLSRPDYGRYNRLLAPGTYTLRFIKADYTTKTLNGVSVTNSGPTTRDVLLAPLHPRPPAPELTTPVENDSLYFNFVFFAWDPSLYADRYLLEVAYDPDFAEIAYYDSTITEEHHTSGELQYYNDYFWRVKGGNSNGWGPYSATRAFWLDMESGNSCIVGEPCGFAISQNYPNPFNADTKIKFSLDAPSDVTLEVFNIIGQRVEVLFDGSLDAGSHSVIWNADRYPSGMYFARLSTIENSRNIRMLLLK